MVHPDRIYCIKSGTPGSGPVVYWMQRDQRVRDNWALLFAAEQASVAGRNLRVVFCLVSGFLGAPWRHYAFMLGGLQEVSLSLKKLGIPFDLVYGEPGEAIPGFLHRTGAGMLVADFNPLRQVLTWKAKVAASIRIPFYDVDAHNILPARKISGKQEYSAFTFRKKVEPGLREYLVEFPEIKVPGIQPFSELGSADNPDILQRLVVDEWENLPASLSIDRSVPAIRWAKPGEKAAHTALDDFLAGRLETYHTDRNFPDRKGQSDLSPWLHFGQLSAQRVALEIIRSDAKPESKGAFMEELIVRRELSDNFCLYNPAYDSVSGFQRWAVKTLDDHRADPREYLYTPEQFEQALTHDPLWNAAQTEMVRTGKMHGYMRMYWAKKILEWTASPEEALEIAVYLNDRYSLDGRDPNGYAGISWSIGGTHDRPWGERKIFGMIRYMNFSGCKRKFNIDSYIRKVMQT